MLRISPVSSADAGTWTCHRASEKKDHPTKEAEGQKSWRLIVLPGIEKVFAFGDNKGSSVITASEGDDVDLACAIIVRKQNVRDGAKSVLRWTSKTAQVEGLDLSRQETAEHFVQNNDEVLGFVTTLELLDVDRDLNRADLSCSAHFGVASFTLEVEYPPTFTIKRVPGFGIPVLSGMTVSLECDADVRPKTFGSWLKDEEEMASENGTVVIYEAGLGDVGWYQCYILYNGEEYSSIAYFLSVKEREKSPEEEAGDTLKGGDSSPTAGDPSPNVKKSALSAADEAEQNTDLKRAEMVAESVIYTEEEDNSSKGGKNCSNFFFRPAVTQYRGPQVSSLNGTRIGLLSQGQRLVLAFRVCSNPKPHTVYWITPTGNALTPGDASTDGVLRAGDLRRSNLTCHVASLEVSASAQQHMGRYILLAWNPHGLQDGEIEVRDLTSSFTGQGLFNKPVSALILASVLIEIVI